MTDTEKVKALLEEVKEIFKEADDKEAREILKEIKYFQRIDFQL